MWLIDPVNSAF